MVLTIKRSFSEYLNVFTHVTCPLLSVFLQYLFSRRHCTVFFLLSINFKYTALDFHPTPSRYIFRFAITIPSPLGNTWFNPVRFSTNFLIDNINRVQFSCGGSSKWTVLVASYFFLPKFVSSGWFVSAKQIHVHVDGCIFSFHFSLLNTQES